MFRLGLPLLVIVIGVVVGVSYSRGRSSAPHRQSAPVDTTGRPTGADILYFSFITLTTTGYGDITAANRIGRTTAMVEAMVGQLYLVTVLALLVSNLGRTRRPAEPSEVGDEPPQT